MVEGNQGAAQLGKVASAGDVNGDGFGDVLVGAPGYDGVFPDSGRVSVYLGSILGLSETPAWTVDGDLEDSGLGVDVASGDVNGDGFSDVIVQGFQGGWRVFAFFGSARGLSNTAAWSAVRPAK